MRRAIPALLFALLASACGGSIVGEDPGDGSASLDAGDAGEPQDAGDAGDAGGPQDAGEPPDAGDAGEPVDAGSDAGADAGPVADPNSVGPYTFRTLDSTMNVAASGDNGVAIHCAYPTAGPSSGPYPVVIVAHGLSLAASQYYGYVTRLASFGYVALTVDYPASALSVNNTKEVADLIAGIGWAASNATVGPIANTQLVGMTGHSLGGKLALLAATMDARIKAAFVLDPVDGGGPGGCSAPACIEVAPLMTGLHIPTGFLGETTDATGGLQPCAPAASNYTTFYAKTPAPSLEVTALGASHMSFLDNESSCGALCALCTAGTASNAQVVGMAHAYVAAFYERYLRGNTAYETYLTGPLAQARYVSTAEATIGSR